MSELPIWAQYLIDTGVDVTKSYWNYDLARRQIQAGYIPYFPTSRDTERDAGFLGGGFVASVPKDNSNNLFLILIIVVIVLLIKK